MPRGHAPELERCSPAGHDRVLGCELEERERRLGTLQTCSEFTALPGRIAGGFGFDLVTAAGGGVSGGDVGS